MLRVFIKKTGELTLATELYGSASVYDHRSGVHTKRPRPLRCFLRHNLLYDKCQGQLIETFNPLKLVFPLYHLIAAAP